MGGNRDAQPNVTAPHSYFYGAFPSLRGYGGAIRARSGPGDPTTIKWRRFGDVRGTGVVDKSRSPARLLSGLASRPAPARGRPLYEAVVAYGPFVMNTEAKIEQAYADYRAGRFGPSQGVREFGLLRAVVRLRLVRAPSLSDPVEHHAQIVCGHRGDCRSRESDGLRDRGDRFEVSQTPGRVAIAKPSVERLVAQGRCESFAFVRAIEIERGRRRKNRGRAPDQSERRVPR